MSEQEADWAQLPIAKLLRSACFATSAAAPQGYPADIGCEVGFVGRSNVGKSTCINTLVQQKRLAHTSKTPGRTQLINFFDMSDTQRLVDLPGYGYAKVPLRVKRSWAENIEAYLAQRQSLRGIIWLIDCRRGFQEEDELLLEWLVNNAVSLHVVMSKSDKLSRNQAQQALFKLRKDIDTQLKDREFKAQITCFSALKRDGFEAICESLTTWLIDPS